MMMLLYSHSYILYIATTRIYLLLIIINVTYTFILISGNEFNFIGESERVFPEITYNAFESRKLQNT